MGEPLQAVSNVIKLKPEHKYLLVFRGIDYHQAEATLEMLREMGIDSMGIALSNGDELEVIEIPEKI